MKPMANILFLATIGNDLGLNGKFWTPAADEANGQCCVFGNNWQRSGAEQPIASIPKVGWCRTVCVCPGMIRCRECVIHAPWFGQQFDMEHPSEVNPQLLFLRQYENGARKLLQVFQAIIPE